MSTLRSRWQLSKMPPACLPAMFSENFEIRTSKIDNENAVYILYLEQRLQLV